MRLLLARFPPTRRFDIRFTSFDVHGSLFDFARAEARVYFFSVVCIRKNSSQARRAENSGRVSHRLLFQLTLPGLDGLRRN